MTPATEGFYVSAWKGTHIEARKFVTAQTPADAKRLFCAQHPEFSDLVITVEGTWK